MNVIIDGNNFMFKAKSVLFKEIGNLETSYQEGILMRKCATDFIYTLKLFPNIKKVIWAQDNSSWRKNIQIDEGAYKANRVKDDDFNWNRFYELMNEFGKIIETKGGIYSNLRGAEADDLIMLWGNYFFEKGEDTIGVSSDRDLQQTSKWNGDNYMLIYDSNTKSRKLVAPIGFKENFLDVESVVDVFNMSAMFKESNNKDALKDLINKNALLEVDTKLFAFTKILHGDGGDNIPSVYWYIKNDRKYKVSEAKAEKYYLELNDIQRFSILDLKNDEDLRLKLASLIERDNKKTKDLDPQYLPNVNKISDNILRNIDLVYLNYDIIPDYITDAFNKYVVEKDKGGFAKGMNRINLLEGTVFAKDMNDSTTKKDWSAFSGMNIDLPDLEDLI